MGGKQTLSNFFIRGGAAPFSYTTTPTAQLLLWLLPVAGVTASATAVAIVLLLPFLIGVSMCLKLVVYFK